MKKYILPFAMCISCASFMAHAAEPAFLSLSIGYFNPLKNENNEADFRLEYRPASPVFMKYIKPWGGIEVTSKASIWAGGGFLLDIKLSDKTFLTPSLGLGFYAQGNSDIDLDYPLQFRSQLEISHVFQNESRLGLAFSHISNAGLGDHNPGVEILSLYFSYPLNRLFGNKI